MVILSGGGAPPCLGGGMVKLSRGKRGGRVTLSGDRGGRVGLYCSGGMVILSTNSLLSPPDPN